MPWRNKANSLQKWDPDVRVHQSTKARATPNNKRDVLVDQKLSASTSPPLYDPSNRRRPLSSLIVEVPRPRHSDAFNSKPFQQQPTSYHAGHERRDEKKHVQLHTNQPHERTAAYEVNAPAINRRRRRRDSQVKPANFDLTSHAVPSPWIHQAEEQQKQQNPQHQYRVRDGPQQREQHSAHGVVPHFPSTPAGQWGRTTPVMLKSDGHGDYESSRQPQSHHHQYHHQNQSQNENQQQQQQQQSSTTRSLRPRRPTMVHRTTPTLPYPTDRRRPTTATTRAPMPKSVRRSGDSGSGRLKSFRTNTNTTAATTVSVDTAAADLLHGIRIQHPGEEEEREEKKKHVRFSSSTVG